MAGSMERIFFKLTQDANMLITPMERMERAKSCQGIEKESSVVKDSVPTRQAAPIPIPQPIAATQKRLDEDHSSQKVRISPHSFECSEIAEIVESEIIKCLPSDCGPDDESEKDCDSEVDRFCFPIL